MSERRKWRETEVSDTQFMEVERDHNGGSLLRRRRRR